MIASFFNPNSFARAISVLLLLCCAFQNQFVLLHFGDTAKYIEYGFRWNHTGGLFSFAYALFVRGLSFGFSLWLVALAQAVLGERVLSAATRRITGIHNPWITTLVVAVLVVGTSLSRLASTIMPDFFAGITGLALVNLFLAKNQRERILAAVAVALLGCIHTALWPVYILLGGILLPVMLKRSIMGADAAKTILVALLGCIPLIFLTNYFVSHRLYLSKTTPVMLTARMAETGLMDAYLERHCPDGAPSVFCAYKGRFQDDNAYMWDFDASPLYQIKPHDNWEKAWEDPEVHQELNRMVVGMLKDPALWPAMIRAGLASWGNTLFNLNYVGDNQRFDWFSNLLVEFLPADARSYANSYQAKGFWDGAYDKHIIDRNATSVAGALLLAVIALVFYTSWSRPLQVSFWVVAGYVLLHALICGVFSGPHPRYADRVNWLLVWWALCFLLELSKPYVTKVQSLLQRD